MGKVGHRGSQNYKTAIEKALAAWGEGQDPDEGTIKKRQKVIRPFWGSLFGRTAWGGWDLWRVDPYFLDLYLGSSKESLREDQPFSSILLAETLGQVYFEYARHCRGSEPEVRFANIARVVKQEKAEAEKRVLMDWADPEFPCSSISGLRDYALRELRSRHGIVPLDNDGYTTVRADAGPGASVAVTSSDVSPGAVRQEPRHSADASGLVTEVSGSRDAGQSFPTSPGGILNGGGLEAVGFWTREPPPITGASAEL